MGTIKLKVCEDSFVIKVSNFAYINISLSPDGVLDGSDFHERHLTDGHAKYHCAQSIIFGHEVRCQCQGGEQII